MKRLLAPLIVLVMIAGLILWMAGGIQRARTFEEGPIQLQGVAPRPRAVALDDASTITVLSWNIAWGYGFGSEGTGKSRPKEHFERSLLRLAEIIRQVDADIVLMQEVDFDSTRSHRIDQAERIAAAANMPFVAKAVSWSANWVPFPYWPPSEHFGHMRSGGAVISRYPITQNQIELLQKPSSNPFWYNLMYLFRYIEKCQITVGKTTLDVLNVHFEAFDEPNRLQHAEGAKARLATALSPRSVFGGDFNAVPRSSKLKSHYPDESTTKTSHENDRTLEIINEIPGLKPVVSDERFGEAQARHFTFPAHAPNRMLDHLFVAEGLEVLEARVVTEAGDVSDHLPLLARLRIR